MRYDHISPQYQYLMGKIEEQEKKIKELEGRLQFAYEYNDSLIRDINRKDDEIEHFNRLPWYKKMICKLDGLWWKG